MRRWVAGILVVSLLAVPCGFAADTPPARSEPRTGGGPLAMQITGGVLAGLGTGVVLATAGDHDIESAVMFTAGLIGLGAGVGLFTAGTIWRSHRAREAARSGAQPSGSLEINLIGSAPGLLARVSF